MAHIDTIFALGLAIFVGCNLVSLALAKMLITEQKKYIATLEEGLTLWKGIADAAIKDREAP